MEDATAFNSFLIIFIIITQAIYSFKISTIISNNENDKYSNQIKINYTNTQQVLINKDLLIMNNTLLSYNSKESSHDFLIATQLNNSWISNTTNEGPWKTPISMIEQKESNIRINEKDRFAIIELASFNLINIQLTDYIFNMTFLIATKFQMVNSYFKFDGLISLNQIAKSTFNKENQYHNAIITKIGTLILNENYDKIQQNEDNKGEGEGKEVNQLTESTDKYSQFVKCDMIPSIYWSFNGSYILFGNEYDIYLIRLLNKTVVLDRLSYYSLIPFDEWNYFKKEYFGKNEDCVNVLIEGSQPKMYYIQCSKLKNKNDNRKIINFIIANYSIQYGDVFDEALYLENYTIPYLNPSVKTYVYFNFLFCEKLNHWVLGANFFKNKTIGFDYKLNQTLIELIPLKSFNFTQYFTPKKSHFKFCLFIGTSIVAVIIFLISGMLSWRSRRQLDKEFHEITKTDINQQKQIEDELIKYDKDNNVNQQEPLKILNSLIQYDNNNDDDNDIIEEDPIDEEISIVNKIIQ